MARLVLLENQSSIMTSNTSYSRSGPDDMLCRLQARLGQQTVSRVSTGPVANKVSVDTRRKCVLRQDVRLVQKTRHLSIRLS